MKLPYWVLTNDLQQRGIKVDYKDLNYEVLDSETGGKFVKAIREYDDLLTKFSKDYEVDIWDCDDYATLFKAICHLVGFTCAYAEGSLYMNNQLVGRHAFNLVPWMVGTNLTWLVVEPQCVGVYGYQWFSTLGTYNKNGSILGLYVYVVDYVWL
jgi:hypothetical protein